MAPAGIHDLVGMGAGMAQEVLRHFQSTKQYIRSLQEPKSPLESNVEASDDASNQAAREAAEASREMEAKRWEGINV